MELLISLTVVTRDLSDTFGPSERLILVVAQGRSSRSTAIKLTSLSWLPRRRCGEIVFLYTNGAAGVAAFV